MLYEVITPWPMQWLSRKRPATVITSYSIHYTKLYDLVPDDAAVVGFAERPTGDFDEPDAGQVGDGEQEKQLAVAEEGTKQDDAGPGEQRAESARRPRRQPAAAAAGEEMRRVGEQEAEAGRLSQSGRIV